MTATELGEWVVRVQVTPAQRKALKQLAVEREQELRELFTAALQTSPLTRQAFQPKETTR